MPKYSKVSLLGNDCVDESLSSTLSAIAITELSCESKANKENVIADEKDDSAFESSNKISCWDTRMLSWYHNSWQETCLMNDTEVIESEDFKVLSEVSSVTLLFMDGNDEIFFLPIALHRTFPALFAIKADFCSIKKISKPNFQGLRELTFLHLRGNLIEAVKSDTFIGLAFLRYVDLSTKFEAFHPSECYH